jgi:UTP--glucose-1-phosphate uridylyltransferase
VLKLNGRLGTSMGLEKAKSLLEPAFLDLICQQVKFMRAFILMDSFSTSADTRAFLARSFPVMLSEPFMQNMSPKVDMAAMMPAANPSAKDVEW